MGTRRRAASWVLGLACVGVLGPFSPARAQDEAAIQAVATRPPLRTASSLLSLLSETRPSLNLRVRAEFADQAGADEAVGYTARARIGATTPEYGGLQGFVELEHNEGFGIARANRVVQGDPTKSVVADPESTELNQAFLTYSLPRLQLKLGRQKIILGEGVFVGDIDFRQNGQTFDALTVSARPSERLELFYSYVYNVNRLFGTGDGKELNSDSRSTLVQTSYTFTDLLKVRAFGYLFDLQQRDVDGLSTRTLGVSLTGSRIVGNWLFEYRADTSTQSDAAESPLDYRARYYYVSASAATRGVQLTAGRERFGVDGDADIGFANTLDTTYRDLFITTPANGLSDNFVQLGAQLPRGLSAQIQYHRFSSATESRDYGQQVQGVVRQELAKNIALLVRAFNYRDDQSGPSSLVGTLPPDTFRYSVQVDFQFN